MVFAHASPIPANAVQQKVHHVLKDPTLVVASSAIAASRTRSRTAASLDLSVRVTVCSDAADATGGSSPYQPCRTSSAWTTRRVPESRWQVKCPIRTDWTSLKSNIFRFQPPPYRRVLPVPDVVAIISRIAAGAASLPTGRRRTPSEHRRRKGATVPGSPTVVQPSRRHYPLGTGALEAMEADREQLTHLLRGLASRLDELDRRLADLAWRRLRPHAGAFFGETLCERTALESERERLTGRLGMLAQRLNTLDGELSGVNE